MAIEEEYDGLVRRVSWTRSQRIFVATDDEASPGIRIGLPVLRLKPLQKSIDIGFWNNASLGIIPYGAGVVTDFAAELGIPRTTDFEAELGIPTPTIADPTAALAANLGQGSMLIQWLHPEPELVSYYEVYGSVFDGGPYTKLQHGEFKVLHGIIHNVPMASQIYLQIRAVGFNLAVSNFVPVRQGKFQSPSVRCSVRAISGSTIPAGAIFVSRDEETGRLVGLRAEQNITINC